MRFFEHAGLPFSCGKTKTDVFEYDDVIHHTAHTAHALLGTLTSFQRFRVDVYSPPPPPAPLRKTQARFSLRGGGGQKRFEYISSGCLFAIKLENRKNKNVDTSSVNIHLTTLSDKLFIYKSISFKAENVTSHTTCGV